MGTLELNLVELERHAVVYSAKQHVFMVPNGHCLKLGGGCDNLEQATELRRACEREVEDIDCGVTDIVKAGNHTQVERTHIHIIFDGNAFTLLKLTQRVFDKLR